MIIKNIKIFSQNVWKNNLIVNMILETHFEFDIIFIQKLSWSTIHTIPSWRNRDGEELVGVPNHPNWPVFANMAPSIHDYPRVIIYINTKLSPFWFSLHKDILNYRNISLISFFNNNNMLFLINIYSDSLQSALKYLKNTEVDIHNILVMTGDLNIRDNFWDLIYPYHSTHSDLLIDITDSLSLGLFYPTNPVPTKYSDNNQSLNLVINLMFLRYDSKKLDNYTIVMIDASWL